MNLTRRGFVKASGAAIATSLAFGLTSQSTALAGDPNKAFKLEGTRESPNICCYCAGGCGSLCSSKWEGDHWELVNLEGDPDHPINEGGLCPKGAAMSQLPLTRAAVTLEASVSTVKL